MAMILTRALIQRTGTLSYAVETLWRTADLLPPRPRMALLRRALGQCGRMVWIEYGCRLRRPERIRVADDVIIGQGCRLMGYTQAEISIGSHVMLAQEVLISTVGHRFDPEHHQPPLFETTGDYGPVSIGEWCWLGARSVIVPGVQVGEGVIVAAGAVVTRDVEPWTVVAGVPARVIKKRSETRADLERMGARPPLKGR